MSFHCFSSYRIAILRSRTREADEENRVRGYQYRSQGPGEVKRNTAAYAKYATTGADGAVQVPVEPKHALGGAIESQEDKRGNIVETPGEVL